MRRDITHLQILLTRAVVGSVGTLSYTTVGTPDLGMTRMECQNKRRNKTNFNLSCFREIYKLSIKECRIADVSSI
jgi:hypothetical protein